MLFKFLLRQRTHKLMERDQATWWDIMGKMQVMLRKGALELFMDRKMDREQMHNYVMSGRLIFFCFLPPSYILLLLFLFHLLLLFLLLCILFHLFRFLFLLLLLLFLYILYPRITLSPHPTPMPITSLFPIYFTSRAS